MNIEFDEKETEAIKKLAKDMDVSEEKVIRQALGTYQLISTGLYKLERVENLRWMGGTGWKEMS